MNFSHPPILWALFLLLIPIIIHLFNFRRYRKIYFTNVKELQEITIKTKKNARLKKIIVLILRMLALAALVIAFAGPYRGVPAADTQQSDTRLVSVYIDNSFSMEATEGGMPLLEIAKKRADEIARTYAVSDRFQLVTNDFTEKQQRFLNRDEFAEEVQKVTYSPVVRTIEAIETRQNHLLASVEGSKNRYFISDFQRSTHQLEQLQGTPDVATVLMPLEAAARTNISVDSCWFASPIHRIHLVNHLFVRLRSSAEESLKKIPIRLIINGQQVGLANFDIESKSETVVEIPFTLHEKMAGKATLEITDYPITFDDKLYFTFSVSDEIGVIELTDNTSRRCFSTLFGNDSAFRFVKSDINRFDFSLLERHSMVVLDAATDISSGLAEALQTFVSTGGSLVVFCSTEDNMQHISHLLSRFESPLPQFLDTVATRFEQLALRDPFFDDVFERIPDNMEMPTVLQHWDFSPDAHSDPLITLENGAPALLRMPYENGLLYLFTFSPDEAVTNFQQQPLFVPVLLRIALMSVQNNALYATIGRAPFVSFNNLFVSGDVTPKIVNEHDFSFIPGVRNLQNETRFLLYDNIKESGFFAAICGADTLHFAMNYDRQESQPECFDADQLRDFLAEQSLPNVRLLENGHLPVSEALTLLYQGDVLWRWFLLVVLLCLLGEVLVLRFWK